MKITRDTPDQLIIESNPWLIALMIGVMMLAFIGAALALFGEGEFLMAIVILLFCIPFLGLFLVLFVRRNQLILDRASGKLTHRRRTLLSYSEEVHDLALLDRAIVERSQGSEGGSTYRMAYVLSGGPKPGAHPFTLVYTSGGGAERMSNAVNTWLGQGTSA
jgi:hypothetical protein